MLRSVITAPEIRSLLENFRGRDARYTFAVMGIYEHVGYSAATRRLNAMTAMQSLKFNGDPSQWKLGKYGRTMLQTIQVIQWAQKHHPGVKFFVENVDFSKIVGRDEHGMNLQKRKIQRLSAQIIFKDQPEELKYLQKLHDEAGKRVMENLERDYNLVSKEPLSKSQLRHSKKMEEEAKMKHTVYKNSEILQKIKFEELKIKDKYSKMQSNNKKDLNLNRRSSTDQSSKIMRSISQLSSHKND